MGEVTPDSAAQRLVERALYLNMYGERAPGGEQETWAAWCQDAEAFLRGAMGVDPDA